MKKAANLLFTLCFAAFLAGVLAVTWGHVGKVDFSEFENRRLEKEPEYTAESFSDGSYLNGWERYFLDRAAGRDRLIKWNTLLHMDVLHNPVVNRVVVTKTNLLPFYSYGVWDEVDIKADVRQTADRLDELKQHVEDLGGTLVYVGVPAQADYFADRYPAYLEHGQAYFPTVDLLWAEALKERNIPYVDMPAVFRAEGNPDRYYSITDHHYSIYGALKTYQELMARVNELTGYDLNILQEEDLVFLTLPNPMLGSRNRMLYGLYKTEEKMVYALPKVLIPFTRTDNGKEVADSVVTLPDTPKDPVGYTIFFGGDVGETILQTDRKELPNALIVGDSYTNAVESLLYTSFNETRSIDLRHYTKQSLWDYIEDYQPQVVVILRDTSTIIVDSPNGTYR